MAIKCTVLAVTYLCAKMLKRRPLKFVPTGLKLVDLRDRDFD